MKIKYFYTVFFAVILSLHACFRGVRSDYDAEAYRTWFEQMSRFGFSDFLLALGGSNLYFQGDVFFSFELGFAILSFLITRLASDGVGAFFVLTFISLLLKLVAIQGSCPKPNWAIAWYITWSYLLLEMTTQRAGLSASIVLLGFSSLFSGRYLRFVGFVCIASLFHLSALVALLLIPVHARPLGRQGLFVGILFGVFLSNISILPLIEFFGYYNSKIAEYYLLFRDVGFYESVNKLNVVILLRMLLLFFGVFAARGLYYKIPGFRFSANIFALSIFLYYALATFPLLGGRIYEFLGVFQVYFIGFYARIFRRNLSALALLIVVMIIQFYTLVFHVKFVDFFYFVGDSYNIETEHKAK